MSLASASRRSSLLAAVVDSRSAAALARAGSAAFAE
jgi:hypothetical protein